MAVASPKLEANLASILKTSFDSRPEAERSTLETWLLTEGLYDVRDFALLSPDLETVPDAVRRPAGVGVTVGSSIAAKKAWTLSVLRMVLDVIDATPLYRCAGLSLALLRLSTFVSRELPVIDYC